MNKPSILLISILSFIHMISINGATKTWNKSVGGAWTTAGNWTPSGTPVSGDDIIINTDQSAVMLAD